MISAEFWRKSCKRLQVLFDLAVFADRCVAEGTSRERRALYFVLLGGRTVPIRRFSNASIASKLAFVGVLSLLAVIIPSWSVIDVLRSQVRVSEHELLGIPALQTTTQLIHASQVLRGLSTRVAAGDTTLDARRNQAVGDVNAALQQLQAEVTNAEFDDLSAQVSALQSDWQKLQTAVLTESRQVFDAHSLWIDQQMTLLDQLRDASAYVYTPYIDSYHLMNAVLVESAHTSEALARARGLGAALILSGDSDPARVDRESLLQVAAEMQVSAASWRRQVRELDKASELNDSIKAAMDGPRQAANTQIQAALQLVSAQLSDAGQPGGAEAWFSTFSTALDAQFTLTNTGIMQLQVLSQGQRDAVAFRLWVTVGIASAMILLIGGLLWRRGRQIVGTMQFSVRLASRIADGRLDNAIRIDRQDESGQLLSALQRMQDKLRDTLEHERELAAENARVRSALDIASVGMMIADVDARIIYMNTSVNSILHQAEAEIRTRLKDFSADRVLGQPFDIFHADPSHNRRLVLGLERPHRASIQVGRAHFALTASPIFDADGGRIGTALEWADKTTDVEIQFQLGRVVQAAAAGDLGVRMPVPEDDPRMAEVSRGINSLLGTVATAVGEVQDVMSALAEGDLSARSQATLSGAFAQLRDDVNRTSEYLSAAVGDIQRAVESIDNAAAEIASGNADLSDRTEQQAANLEEAAAAMEELTSTVRVTSDNATQASRLSTDSAARARDGGVAVKAMIGTMSEIEQSSRKVADIISTIDGIAFQTNILALNAAVEAARAGDQGRGFAVVAGEVRALAQRSAQAAKEISQLIHESVEKVNHGSRQVSHVGAAIESIVQSAEQVASIVSEISAATQEQTSGIEQVNHTVTEMDQVTQQNAALVEEVSAASHSMEDQARALANVVAQFRLASQSDAAREAELGVDFEAMVAGHQAWKQRLFNFMGGHGEAVDPTTASRDDVCALGKWIHAEGQKKLGHLAEFEVLRKHHAAFHHCAGDVAACVHSREMTRAESTLVGPFVEHTTRTVSALRSLKRVALREMDRP